MKVGRGGVICRVSYLGEHLVEMGFFGVGHAPIGRHGLSIQFYTDSHGYGSLRDVCVGDLMKTAAEAIRALDEKDACCFKIDRGESRDGYIVTVLYDKLARDDYELSCDRAIIEARRIISGIQYIPDGEYELAARFVEP